MLCLFGSISIFVNDLGTRTSFWVIAGLWSITYFITLIPISINGYGVQELVFTFLLSNVIGLTPAVGATIALLIRAYFLLSSLPGAAFLPSILSALAKQKTAISSADPLLLDQKTSQCFEHRNPSRSFWLTILLLSCIANLMAAWLSYARWNELGVKFVSFCVGFILSTVYWVNSCVRMAICSSRAFW